MQHESHRPDGFPVFYAKDLVSWRAYLREHHDKSQNVWLLLYKKASGTPSVTVQEAVDEALCFGWIDSKPNKRDQDSYFLFFAQRNPKSNWSRVNKEKIARLAAEGRLSPAGLKMIQQAKESGTWNALDEVENLIIPPDMQAAFAAAIPEAKSNWDHFPRSTKRGILEWIFNAKRQATRQKRIHAAVEKASRNERANQWP